MSHIIWVTFNDSWSIIHGPLHIGSPPNCVWAGESCAIKSLSISTSSGFAGLHSVCFQLKPTRIRTCRIWVRLYLSLSLCFPVTGSVLPKQDMNSPSGSSFFMLFINTFRSSNRIFQVQIFSVWLFKIFWRDIIFFGTFHFLSSFLRASFIFEYSLRFGFKYMLYEYLTCHDMRSMVLI